MSHLHIATATPRETVAAVLQEPAIKKAIRRGSRKARVKEYASVTKSGRDGVCEHISDFEQATYLALLEHHAQTFAALAAEQRAGFVEKLAMRIAWQEVYPMKREVPLAADHVGSEGTSPQVFECDDISLNRRNRRPNWMSAHAEESKRIKHIDRQRAGTPPGEEPETRYEHMCRLLGEQNADWMLDYENSRYESAKPPKYRVKYHRLRKKLNGM